MKLATIEKIETILLHPNADRLQIVKVLGFQCIVPVGLYKEGDTIVYIQPDTVLPKDQEWAKEYLKYSPKRVKAVRLRSVWSEGIVAPLSIFELMGYKWGLESLRPNGVNFEHISCIQKPDDQLLCSGINLEIGLEVSELIGVVKYDPPLPKDTDAKGGLPFNLPITDEPRVENLEENEIPYGEIVDITTKLDGQSSTHGYKLDKDYYFVTGRKYEVFADTENRYTIHSPKIKNILIDFCKKYNVSLAFRIESYGNGIQSNHLNVHSAKPRSFAVFSVWNLDERRYEEKGSPFYYVKVCKETGLESVPMLEENVVLTKELIKKYSIDLEVLPNGNHFEGVVIKHKNGSFKIINKFYDSNK